MYYTQLTEDQQKQLINAAQSYSAMLNFRQAATGYRGGMVWRQKAGTDYLVKTSPEGSQRGMGARSPETEALAEAFLRNKARAEENLKASKQRVEQEVRLNRALRVGRCPNLVIDILNRLDKAGLAKHLMVIGTHALYAYESGVGVTFSPAITETRDLDILWDSRKRLSLASNEDVNALGLLGILQQVDNSFTLMKDQTYTAVNKDGYMVDVVAPSPVSLSPAYKQIVIGVNGKMAEMHAPDPRAFAMFKHWLSQQPERDATKTPRDQRQAEAVRSLVEEFMPHMPFSDLAGFPTALRYQTA